MVTAKGMKGGRKLTVKIEDQDGLRLFLFDGADDLDKENEIDKLLRDPRPLMGTYWPICDALKLAAVLPYFFDRGGLEKLDVDDPEAEKELADLENIKEAVY